MTPRDRWPGWVYDDGDEPDYRFSLANERTFLAWIRTSMALLASAVVLDTIQPESRSDGFHLGLTVLLLVLGLSCAVVSWVRWAKVERAMRRNEPLPSSSPTAWLALVLVLVAVLLVAFVA